MTRETVPANRRIYLTLAPGSGGVVNVKFGYMPPAVGEAVVAILSRGVLMSGESLQVPLVSDPSAVDALRGLSAYQVARQQGYGGTTTQWLASLIGAAGASAYDLARAAGYGGTVTQWLASLIGAAGASAYAIAQGEGFTGSKAQWLASLKGKDASAYLGAVTIGQTATVVIQAGVRRLVVTIPAALGVAAGDSLYLAPTKAIDGYALHDVVAVSPTSLSIGLTAPLLAVGASFAIPCKLFRLAA